VSILITGGLGYIGSHIAKKLYINGFTNIVILDDLSSGIITNNKYGFINCDITNQKMLEKIFSEKNISCVFHIAGKAFVKDSFEKIDEYYNTNVIGTINILNMMVKYNVKKIIFSSSCSVYGNAEVLPITESTELNPLSPYGNTKKICEDVIKDYGRTNNINYVILRYFNVAGNDFNCEVCDSPNNNRRIIPTIILKIMKDEVMQVNGNTYNTKDGTCSRNYIHVDDLATAHLRSYEYLKKSENLVCNIGSLNNYTILEIIKKIEDYLDKKAKYFFGDKINGDPDIVYCDGILAEKELKFREIYNIDDIISSYVNLFNRLN